MAKPLVGKILPSQRGGDSSESLAVVHNIIEFMEWYGVRLNVWDHFYPAMDDQCASIEGIPANVWWSRYVLGDIS